MKDLAPVAVGAAAGLVVALLFLNADDTKPLPAPVGKPPQQARLTVPLKAMPERLPLAREPAIAPIAPDVSPSAGTPAWQRFAVAAPPVAGRPMIAVIIDDMGVDRRRSERAVALPGPLTLSYLTYARDLPQQTAAAHRAGHELMVHVPMEPESSDADPGPNALRVGLAPDELARRIDWSLTRFAGYVGINNHEGSRFTTDAPGMAEVLRALHRRGLLYVDSRTTAKTVAPGLARGLGVPYAERNVFLDDRNDVPAVEVQFGRLEQVARRAGYAIAIGHPRDATLAVLAAWLPGFRERGFVLVPVSAIVRHRIALAQNAVRKAAGP